MDSLSNELILEICNWLSDKDKFSLLITCRKLSSLFGLITLTGQFDQISVIGKKYYSQIQWLENIYNLDLPHNLKKAHFKIHYAYNIDRLPPNLEELSINIGFKGKIVESVLPKKLKRLDMNSRYNYTCLPNQLTFLSLICDNNFIGRDLINLRELHLYNFTGKLIGRLPETLKILQMDYDFQLESHNLPESLETLVLFRYYHRLCVLPKKLKVLYLGCAEFSSSIEVETHNIIDQNVLPDSLERFHVCGWTINTQLPLNLIELVVRNYRRQLYFENGDMLNIKVIRLLNCVCDVVNFPKKLKKLQLQHFTGQIINLPEKLISLYILSTNRLSITFPVNLKKFVLINYLYDIDFIINDKLEYIRFRNVKHKHINMFIEELKKDYIKIDFM